MKRVYMAILVIIFITGCFFFVTRVLGSKSGNQAIAREYWPTDGWRVSTPEEQGMDPGVLAEMLNSVKASGKSVNSVTIIRNGYLVSEAYFYPYQKGLKHFMNSCTKSVTSVLTGIAEGEGHIKSVNDKVLDYFKDLPAANIDQRKEKMTVQDLLTMTTGLDWAFSGNVSTNLMLQSANWTQFTLDLPMRENPGHTFNYCNGASQLLSSIVQRTTGKNLYEYALDRLQPLGIKDIYWKSSPENVNTGYEGLYMHPDDAAKIGYLYLNKGNWDGKQLIPGKWIEESTRTQVKADWGPMFPGYSYGWWIPRFGGFAALGQGGDYIFVVPESDLVVVFTGGMYDLNDLFYPAELMEKYILPSVKSNAPLKPGPAASKSLKKALDAVQNAPVQESGVMPEIAKEISGKPFTVEDGSTITFNFNSNDCVVYQNSEVTLSIPIDNIYHVSVTPSMYGGLPENHHRADKGRWVDGNTLEVIEQELEEGFTTFYTVHFESDTMELNMKSNLGLEQTFTGTSSD